MAAPALKLPLATPLTGAQRAAVLVMYLDRDMARDLLRKLSTEEVRQIGMAMAEVQQVPPEVIEKVVADFVRDLHELALLPQTGRDFALGVLPGLIDEQRRGRIAGSLRRRLSRDFEDFIASRPTEGVAALLRDEHPQTQAVALVLMGSDNAAKVMGLLDEQDRFDLTLRMSRLREIPGELADDVEQAFRKALEDDGSDRWEVKGLDRAAQILGRLGRKETTPLLAKLARHDKDLSETIKRRMVIFDDLVVLDDRAVQAILKEVDRGDLLLALKGANPEMRELLLGNVSHRAAADFREELEIMGPTPRSQVVRAQENIVEVALRLAEEGAIFLPIGSDAEVV